MYIIIFLFGIAFGIFINGLDEIKKNEDENIPPHSKKTK